MKKAFLLVSILAFVSISAAAQVPMETAVRILRAEDSRNYDAGLEGLLGNKDPKIRTRAALAGGRIGSDAALAPLITMAEKDAVPAVRTMAAFAIGEIESIKAADAVIALLKDKGVPTEMRARLVEAAGKIAGANLPPPDKPDAKPDERVERLGRAIVDVLADESDKGRVRDPLTSLLALTAALRARPTGADRAVALFLTDVDGRIRSDAGNTLSRLRAKNANDVLRGMVVADEDPIARANAARALGAAEDKGAMNILLRSAVSDKDERVRVTAIRTLAALKDPFVVDKLLDRGDVLLRTYQRQARPGYTPAVKNEILEIATVLASLVPKTNDTRTLAFLTGFAKADGYRSAEVETALARISPEKYMAYRASKSAAAKKDRLAASAEIGGLRALASQGGTPEELKIKTAALRDLRADLDRLENARTPEEESRYSEALSAYAAFRPEDVDERLRRALATKSIYVRAAAAGIIDGRPRTDANYDAVLAALKNSIANDTSDNAAQLALLEALFGIDRKRSLSPIVLALRSPDQLVRRKALELIGRGDPANDLSAREREEYTAARSTAGRVGSVAGSVTSGMGRLLNSDADYRRALSRKNGTVSAVLTTQKGRFVIDFLPEEAPLTVDNFVKLARSGYFDNATVHRVVPNFVMQDGDPRGDGEGGPGWSIRCEINMVDFDRGAVGMALAGKDTGGSQWFATHSPQPHLDGGYTVFGKVNPAGMRVVDSIVRGDKILTVRIVERRVAPPRGRRS